MYKERYAIRCCATYSALGKLLVLMKTAVLLTVLLSHVAYAGYGQPVSINVKNEQVTKVLYQLSVQSGYDFVYDATLLSGMEPISLELSNAPFQAALNACLPDESFELVFNNDKTVIIKERKADRGSARPASAIKMQQQVSGTVRDADGTPLAGVTVLVQGTNRGAATDANGQFQLAADAGEVLVFRNVGYTTQEITVGNQTVLDIVLVAETEGLQEVVVVGYGSVQKKDVTGSVTPISMNNVRGQSVASLDQSLSGQVAGVNISTSNGTPGGGPRIQVRGIGAIGAGSEPLYVIDGFPVPSSSGQHSNPMSSINPQDIESMTILKDASATAIYGSRGANGVVMITTRKGASGQPRVTVNASTGLQQVPQKGRPDLMNGQEFAQFRKEAIEDRI